MGTTHSKWLNRRLVYYDGSSWLDAIGSGVKKYLFDGAALPTDDTTGDPTEFTMTVVEAGAGNSTAVLSDGKLLITAAANENDGVNLQLKGEAFLLSGATPCYFGIKFQTNDADQVDILVGLCITDTTLLGGMTDGVYFESLDGSTDVNLVLEKDSTETTSASAVGTLADATDITLEFVYDGTNINSWVNGTLQTQLVNTNLPDDEQLTLSVAFLTGEAVANTMSIDWMRAIQLPAS